MINRTLFSILFITFVANASYAEESKIQCPAYLAIYTDEKENYELSFTKESTKKSSTDQDFLITNKKTLKNYNGNIIYGNGFSIPGVTINFPCQEVKSKGNCDYVGNVYTIDGLNTGYGLIPEKPILFPKLDWTFYGSDRSNPMPSNVWHFKSCKTKP